jgi:hypothetical protein
VSVRRSAILSGYAVAGAVAMLAAACSPGPLSRPGTAAPMNNPIPLGSDAGSGVLESARRQLTGTWDLVALEAAPEEGNSDKRETIDASGTLTYDEYGNLTIDAHTTDPDAPRAARQANILTFKGRAVIDVAKSELKLMDLTGNVDPDEVLAPERRRKYEIAGEMLKLSSFDERGRVTAISTWRRRQQGDVS